MPKLPGIALLCTFGCSGVDVVPVPDSDSDAAARGFRYYQTCPYLLVYSDGSDQLQSRLLYLPDTTRKMSAKPYQFLAGNKSKWTFSNGVLTSARDESDSAVLPRAVVEAAKTVATSLLGAALNVVREEGDQPGHFEVPLPHLFRLDVNGAQTQLVSGHYPNGVRVFVDAPATTEQGGP